MKKCLYSLIGLISCASTLLNASSLEKSVQELGFAVYQQKIAKSETNEVFSPYSIFNALSMVYLGANGTTQEEIAQVLSLEIAQDKLAAELQQMNERLSSSEFASFSIANSLWVDTHTSLLHSFQNSLKNDLNVHLEALSFAHPKQAVARINQWVKENTADQIPQLLTLKDIDKNHKLMLVSALHFEGSWLRPFAKEDTKEQLFFQDSEHSKLTPMMHQVARFSYHENERMQIVLLPLSRQGSFGSDFACFFLLPKGPLQELCVSKEHLEHWIYQSRPQKVHLTLPKFSLEPKYDLIPILESLGMNTAFSCEADFSLMDGSNQLKISKALHQTCFHLDEEGISASAATAIGMVTTCIHRPQTPPVLFEANRPFLFGVVDLKSNVVLFLGKIVDP